MKINQKLAKKYNIAIKKNMTIKEASVLYGIVPNAIRNVIYSNKVRAIKDDKWHVNINDVNNYSKEFSHRILLVPSKRYDRMLPFVLDLLKKNYVVGHNKDDIKCKLSSMEFDACILCDESDIDIVRSVSNITIVLVGKYLNSTTPNVINVPEISVCAIESILRSV